MSRNGLLRCLVKNSTLAGSGDRAGKPAMTQRLIPTLLAVVLAQATTTTTLPPPSAIDIPAASTGTIRPDVPQAAADALLCPLFQDQPRPATTGKLRACQRRANSVCRWCKRRPRGERWFIVLCNAACDSGACDPPLPTVQECCDAGFPVIGPTGSLCPPPPTLTACCTAFGNVQNFPDVCHGP